MARGIWPADQSGISAARPLVEQALSSCKTKDGYLNEPEARTANRKRDKKHPAPLVARGLEAETCDRDNLCELSLFWNGKHGNCENFTEF